MRMQASRELLEAMQAAEQFVREAERTDYNRDDMAMHQERLVRVNPQTGLNGELARRAIELLAQPWKRAV